MIDMPDENDTPATPPEACPTRGARIRAATLHHAYGGVVQFAVGAAMMLVFVLVTRMFHETNEVQVQVPVPGPTTYITVVGQPNGAEAEPGAMGWHQDVVQIAANLDPAVTPQFDQTPAGKAAMGDDDVFLWQTVRKVNNKGAPWYPNVNQQSVGCCVGCGWKHGVDVCQATQILAGKKYEWKPVSVEAIYAASRVDIGGGAIRGDGSVGAWARDAVGKVGVAPMEKIGDVDLTTFSPARARQWGSTGVPAVVKDFAKSHPVKATALVKSWADVKRAISQGYPVAVCSNVGFDAPDGSVGIRDANGFTAPRGTWNHCMCIIGVRSKGREGAFILNSWGDSTHRGPVWPEDAPVAGFWADANTIDRMVSQGDSFALSEAAGFPSRKIPLDWFIQAPVRPRLGFDRELFAVAF
jgi:hypothetical protein